MNATMDYGFGPACTEFTIVEFKPRLNVNGRESASLNIRVYWRLFAVKQLQNDFWWFSPRSVQVCEFILVVSAPSNERNRSAHYDDGREEAGC
jgi:hypothetical protein